MSGSMAPGSIRPMLTLSGHPAGGDGAVAAISGTPDAGAAQSATMVASTTVSATSA